MWEPEPERDCPDWNDGAEACPPPPGEDRAENRGGECAGDDPWGTEEDGAEAAVEAGAARAEEEDPFLEWEPRPSGEGEVEVEAAGPIASDPMADSMADPMMDTLLAGLLEQWEDEGGEEEAEVRADGEECGEAAAAGAAGPEASELMSRLGAEMAEEAAPSKAMPTVASLSERSATRRESVLRLLAAMYPEAASRLTGGSGGSPVQALRREAGDGYVVFHLSGEGFALPLRQVLEADRVPAYTPAPFVPEFVRGVTNRRGEVLPLIDLRLLLGVAPGAECGDGRMLVVRRNETDSPAALLVDGLGGIAWFEGLVGVRLTSQIAGRFPELLRGAGQHRDATVHVMDLDRLFARKELVTAA
jgi:purine-binding chemotaxis protein CheW